MFTANKQFIIRKVIRLRAMAFFKFVIALIVFNTFFGLNAAAQRDVIITQADEEIRCRILDESPTRFVYAYVGPKGTILRNEIFKNLVKRFVYNQYDSDLVLADAKSKKKKSSKNAKKESDDINEELKTSIEQETLKPNAKKEEGVLTKEKEVDEKKTEVNKDLIVSPEEADSKKEIKRKVEAEKKSKEEIAPVSSPIVKKDLDTERKELKPISKPLEKAETVGKSDEQVIEVVKPAVDKKDLEIEKKSLKPVTAEVEKEKPIKKNASETKIQKSPAPVIATNPVSSTGEFKNYLKWRVGVKAGIGNILDNGFEATNAYGLYQEKLLKGWTFGADLAFFPLEGFGLGVVYTDFKSNNSAENLTYLNQITGAEMTGSISNKVSRKFIGPAFFLRKGIDFKTFVVLGVSPGMYLYSDKGEYNGANFEYTGKQFGAAATLGLDFLLGNDIIGRDIILSLEAGYNTGKLNDINHGDGTGMLTLDKPIIMDRLDFSIGLRFMRFPKYLKK